MTKSPEMSQELADLIEAECISKCFTTPTGQHLDASFATAKASMLIDLYVRVKEAAARLYEHKNMGDRVRTEQRAWWYGHEAELESSLATARENLEKMNG